MPHSQSPASEFRARAAWAGKIGCYVDCSNNPYDLRPAVEATADVASRLRKTLPDNQPLAIVFGEPHDMPSRFETMHLLASRLLHDRQQMGLAFEWDHHFWSAIARHGMGKVVPDDIFYEADHWDVNGQALVSANLGYGGFGGTPVAIDDLMAFAYENNVPTAFNCPAQQDTEAALDLNDPFTASLVRQYLSPDSIEDVEITRANTEDIPDSMAVANLGMAQAGMRFAQNTGSKIILQQTGLNHVFGNTQHGCSYEFSLTQAYRNAGMAVLPVFPTVQKSGLSLNILPDSAHNALADSVIIDGMAEERFLLGEEEAEKAFITKKLHKNSGNMPKFHDVRANKEFYKHAANKNADKLLQQYRATRPSYGPS